ncbi:MAG TPA: nucleotide exchange factor GrpE [Gemmatimonadaceae bacterium]|nr:nucleotide exchange factor GrpE [Gemmatimonadaceae bacterium]
MNRSDKDPARRPKREPGDAMTDDFAPVSGEEADDDVETAAEQPEATSVADDSATDPGVESEMERILAEQQDKYLRLAAEYDNYRKRSVRERQEASLRGQAELLRGLLDALDDLTRFAHVDPATTDTKTVVEGVAMVERKMLKTVAGVGLEVINPVDQTFDPATMEAVATEPALSAEDDHVVAKVYQQGYLFKGQLLRPARVVVKQWNG